MKIASVILFLLMSQFGFSQFEINYGNISGFKLGASVSEISKLCGTNLSIPAEEFSFELPDKEIYMNEIHFPSPNCVSELQKKYYNVNTVSLWRKQKRD